MPGYDRQLCWQGDIGTDLNIIFAFPSPWCMTLIHRLESAGPTGKCLPYRMATVTELRDALHEESVVGRLVGQVAGKTGKIVPVPRDIPWKLRHRPPGGRGPVHHVKVLVALRAEAVSTPNELLRGDPRMGVVALGALTGPDRCVYDPFPGWRVMAFHAALPGL